MLIKPYQDTEIPNRPLLKAGETVEVSDELGNTLLHRGLAVNVNVPEGASEMEGYETQDVTPKKRKK